MSLDVTSKTGVVYDPVFLKILEDIPGGVTVKTNRMPSTTLQLLKGAMLQEDASTDGLFNVIKTAKSTATQTTGTTYTLDPANLFILGEFVAIEGKTTGVTITRLTKAATTMSIGVARNMGTMATATKLIEVAAAAATLKLYTADSILKDTVRVREDDQTTLYNVAAGAVVRGTVREAGLPYKVETADKTGLTGRVRFA